MEAAKRQTIWNRYFVLACVCAIFTGVCMHMLDSNLAPFADAAWSSKTLGGYLTSTFNIGSILMAFFAGRLSDRKGRRNTLVFGSLLFGVPTFACVFWPTPAVTLTVRFLQGVGKGITTVAAAAIVSDVVPRERMGQGMSFYGLGSTITYAFGPMLALAITANGNYGAMFLLVAALYSASGLLALAIGYEKDPAYRRAESAPAESAAAGAPGTEYRGVWKLIEKKALLPSITYTISLAGLASVLIFVTIYAQEILKLNATQIGLFFTVSAVAQLLVQMFCGQLMDKYSALLLLIPAHLAQIALMLLLAFVCPGNYGVFLLCGALYGVANAAMYPPLNAIAVVDSPAHRNAAANATYFFMMDFGVLFASAVFGPIIDRGATPAQGYIHMFLISVGITLVSLIISLFAFNNRSRARRRERP